MTQHSPDSEITRPDDLARQRLLYEKQIRLEKERLNRENPGFFEESTIPVLGAGDIKEPTTVIRSIDPALLQGRTLVSATGETKLDQDEITFLHPRDVISDEEEETLSAEPVDALGRTELSPERIIAEIEAQARAVSLAASAGLAQEESMVPTVSPEEMTVLDNIPVVTVTSLPQATMAAEEMMRALGQSMEELIGKDSLEGADAYRLYELIKRDPENSDLKAFTLRLAPTRLDYDVFWANLNLLSPQLIQTVLQVGGHQEINLDVETGQQKIIIVYSGKTLQKSLGHVFYAWRADSDNLTMRSVLIKVPLERALEMDSLQSRMAFEDEMEISRLFVRLGRERADDPRLRHLLMPQYRGIDFLAMPLIINKDGESRDLNKMVNDNTVSTQQWAACLAGGARGVGLAEENGFINTDFKPYNIIEGPHGGVVVDLGGFVDTKAYERGEVEIRTNPLSGNLYPLIKNGLRESQSNDFWDINNGNVQRTPAYFSIHLLAQELNGQMPRGSVHKFSLYRMIEGYFIHRGHIARDVMDFIMTGELEKLNYPPIELKASQLSPAEQLLYDLYLKLHQSHRHPWRFRDNNPAHGIDPEHISLGEVIARLDEIASYPQE